MTQSSGVASDMRKLTQAIEEGKRFRVVPTKGGHQRVVAGENHPELSEGTVVTDPQGRPLSLPNTPGDGRWRDNQVSHLINSGVLEHDPWSPPPKEKKRGRGRDLTDPQIQAAKVAGIRERHRRNHEATKELRERAAAILGKLGTWGSNTFSHEIIEVLMYFGESGQERWFETHQSARQALQVLRTGGTLGELNISRLSTFFGWLEEVQESGDLRETWFRLVRESRGLIKDKPEPEPELGVTVFEDKPLTIVPEPVDDLISADPDEFDRAIRLAREERAAMDEAATFALEVLFEMVEGKEVVNRERVLELAFRVWRRF